MNKKIISLLITFAILAVSVFTAGSVSAEESAVHSDGFTEVSLNSSNWSKQGSTSTAVFDTAATDKYHTGSTDTTSLKVSYTALSATAGGASFYYNEYIQNPYGKASALSFWVYSSQAVKLTLLYTDRNIKGSSATTVATKNLTVSVPAGESIVKIPLVEFAKDNTEYSYNYLYQFQIRPFAADESNYSESGDIYIDAVGFYNISVEGDINTDLSADICDLVYLANVANMEEKPADISAYNFYEDYFVNYRDLSLYRSFLLGLVSKVKVTPELREDDSFTVIKNWATQSSWIKNNASTGFTAHSDGEAPFYYAGENDTVALELAYSGMTSSNDARITFRPETVATYGEQSGISAYVYTDQPVTLRMLWTYSANSKNSALVDIELSAGENLVFVPMNANTTAANMPSEFDFNNIQFRFLPNENSVSDSGTIFIDSLGIYDTDPNRDGTFYNIDGWNTVSNWKKNTKCTAYSIETNSDKYYKNDGDTMALKMQYDMTAEANQAFAQVYYTPSTIPSYASDSGISVVVYADQPMTLTMLWTYSNANNSSNVAIALEVGENIINLPMASNTTKETPANFEFNTLQFRFAKNASSTSDTGTIYIDSLGIYDIDATNNIPATE